jgi:hypothetical protein
MIVGRDWGYSLGLMGGEELEIPKAFSDLPVGRYKELLEAVRLGVGYGDVGEKGGNDLVMMVWGAAAKLERLTGIDAHEAANMFVIGMGIGCRREIAVTEAVLDGGWPAGEEAKIIHLMAEQTHRLREERGIE